MISRLLAAAAIAVVGGAGAGSAATLTFNLQGNNSLNYGSLPASFNETEGGVTATFTARSFTDVTFGSNLITSATLATTPPHIGRYPGGAGVVNGTNDDSHTVDGNGYKDFIEISFSESVALSQISFGYYDSSDDFRWMYDSNGDGVIGVGDFISSAFNVASNNPFDGFGGIETSLFAVGAFGDAQVCREAVWEEYWEEVTYWDGHKWKTKKEKKKKKVYKDVACKVEDSWKLKTVTVDNLPPPPPPVPLPAAGWLLVGALGGFAALRRRA